MMLDLSHPDISPHQPGRVSSLVTAHQCPYTAATDGNKQQKYFENILIGFIYSSCCCDLYGVGRVCDTGLREDIQEHGQTGLHLRREENSGSWESHQVEPRCVFSNKIYVAVLGLDFMLRPLERDSTGKILTEFGIEIFSIWHCDVLRYRFICLFIDFYCTFYTDRTL